MFTPEEKFRLCPARRRRSSGGVFRERFVAAFLQIGVVGGVQEKASQVEGEGEMLLLLLGQGGLLGVVALALGGVGVGVALRRWFEHVGDGDDEAVGFGDEVAVGRERGAGA